MFLTANSPVNNYTNPIKIQKNLYQPTYIFEYMSIFCIKQNMGASTFGTLLIELFLKC